MKHIKRIAVGLDFTDMDKQLIRYAAILNKILSPLTVTFINIQKQEDILFEVADLIGKISNIGYDNEEAVMRKKVAEIWKDVNQYDVEYVVRGGQPYKNILKYVSESNTDLLVIGRKAKMGEKGILPTRLARKANTDIFLVPENVDPQFSTIYVPFDYSENAALAFDAAREIITSNPSMRIYSEYFYKVPIAVYSYGKTENDFIELVEQYGRKKFVAVKDTMVDEIRNRIDFAITQSTDESSFGKLINQSAHKNNADLIIIGAKGRTFLSSVFLGSVTEKLISLDKNIPIWIVKQKDEVYNIWKAMKDEYQIVT